MRKLIILCLVFTSLFLSAADQSFDFEALKKAIDLIKQSSKFNDENKSVKANRAKSEAIKILQNIFSENRIYESEFVKTDPSLGWNHGFYFQKTNDVMFIFIDDAIRKSIKTSDEVIEIFEDCRRFKARIQIVKYFNTLIDTPYEINGDFVRVKCKILSITPISE